MISHFHGAIGEVFRALHQEQQQEGHGFERGDGSMVETVKFFLVIEVISETSVHPAGLAASPMKKLRLPLFWGWRQINMALHFGDRS